MSAKFTNVMVQLRRNYSRGVSVENTVEELLSLNYYRFHEVCLATVKYWFNIFLDYEMKHSRIRGIFVVTYEETEAFLSRLLKENPFWTTNHFLDALKINSQSLGSQMEPYLTPFT
ncbi:uncharacterized protein LOC122522779 [Polistes fuscatus]|uniref:uncharacterized protein LOC122522779 n=1 Tax=Polistes fuscatus TaxID=30207 RepID=UPI001CA8545F|nr:uncharacterized protein LOC122522779 [Polistes fuscatus]